MSLETELRTYLLADTGITDIISTRLRPLRLQENETLPAATYQRVTTTPWASLNAAHGSAECLMQIDSYASTYSGAEALAEAIQTRLDGTTDSGNIQAALVNNQFPIYDADLRAYRVMSEYRIHYTVA